MEFNLRITVIIVHVQMYDHLVFFWGGCLFCMEFFCVVVMQFISHKTHTQKIQSIH